MCAETSGSLVYGNGVQSVKSIYHRDEPDSWVEVGRSRCSLDLNLCCLRFLVLDASYSTSFQAETSHPAVNKKKGVAESKAGEVVMRFHRRCDVFLHCVLHSRQHDSFTFAAIAPQYRSVRPHPFIGKCSF